jgi:hypothetical protein
LFQKRGSVKNIHKVQSLTRNSINSTSSAAVSVLDWLFLFLNIPSGFIAPFLFKTELAHDFPLAATFNR